MVCDMSFDEILDLRPMLMETRCLHKKSLNSEDTGRNISVPLAVSTKLYKKKLNFEKKMEDIIPGRMLGRDRLEKNSTKCFIRSGEIPSPDIDRQSQRL